MNIILPMAGKGSRFSDNGFAVPKPLIDVEGRPMFAWALETIKELTYNKLIVVALKEHNNLFAAEETIRKFCPVNTEIIFLDHVTEGQLCTVMAAKNFINTEEELLIISSDTIVKSNLYTKLQHDKVSQGIISVACMPGDRWSFASVNQEGNVVEVAEKIRISDYASTGIYYFRHGNEFVNIAEEIIFNKEKTKGEFFVIPVYQKLIAKKYKVTISEVSEMWDLGTPASLNDFLKHRQNHRAA